MKKITTIIIILMIFLLTYVSYSNAQNQTIYVDDDGTADYTTIQDAIDHANSGDIIFVRDGVYYENVIVDKSVNIVGLNKENTIIDSQKNGTTVTIDADGCLLSNFSLINCEGQINKNWGDAVIAIDGSHDVVIKDNILDAGDVQISSYNHYGAIDLNKCTDCNIINNYIVQSHPNNYTIGIGIHDNSSNNFIIENDISNFQYGIHVDFPHTNQNNKISNNYLHDNEFGMTIQNSYNEILNNTVENNTEVGINIQNSNNNIISGNVIRYNGAGVKFHCGIEIMGDYDNYDNYVSNNIISYNNPCGLQTEYSDGNIITRNNFIENYGIGDSQERWWGNAYVHVQKGFFKKDKFKNNYWSDSTGILPKMIYGYLEIIPYSYYIQWINVDWNPAKEPYDI